MSASDQIRGTWVSC